jgi:dienelactone hydrolase
MPVRLFIQLLRVVGALLLTTAWSLPAQASEPVTFPASRGYTADQVVLRADLSRPEGEGPFPAVVLMHGCGGWQPAVRFTMNAYAEYLTRRGFVVLNLDSFGPRRRGGGVVCETFDQLAQARDYRTHDAHDALRYLQAQPFVDGANVFLMGQSNGGSVAIQVAQGQGPHAADKGYRGVVAFYPWCGAFNSFRVHLKTPLLVLGGERDDWVPAHECKGVRSTGAPLELVIYPEAAHSFDLEVGVHRYLGKLVGKHPQAAEDSRARMVAFFEAQASPPAGRMQVAQN